jgi:hypothetical protein
MVRAFILSASVLLVTGCMGSDASVSAQRFILVPDPAGINKDLPAGALALDTKTGQLCFTVDAAFQASSPSIKPCAKLSDDSRDSKKK